MTRNDNKNQGKIRSYYIDKKISFNCQVAIKTRRNVFMLHHLSIALVLRPLAEHSPQPSHSGSSDHCMSVLCLQTQSAGQWCMSWIWLHQPTDDSEKLLTTLSANRESSQFRLKAAY